MSGGDRKDWAVGTLARLQGPLRFALLSSARGPGFPPVLGHHSRPVPRGAQGPAGTPLSPRLYSEPRPGAGIHGKGGRAAAAAMEMGKEGPLLGAPVWRSSGAEGG